MYSANSEPLQFRATATIGCDLILHVHWSIYRFHLHQQTCLNQIFGSALNTYLKKYFECDIRRIPYSICYQTIMTVTGSILVVVWRRHRFSVVLLIRQLSVSSLWSFPLAEAASAMGLAAVAASCRGHLHTVGISWHCAMEGLTDWSDARPLHPTSTLKICRRMGCCAGSVPVVRFPVFSTRSPVKDYHDCPSCYALSR
jgi:hypothetical protein